MPKTKKILQQIAPSNPVIAPVSITQITHPKKKLFIEHYYATDGNVSFCTQAVKVSRKTFYNWVESDPIFAELIREQKQLLLDSMDQRLRERAKSEKGTTELIFWLKTHHQEYKQNDTFAYRDGDKEFVLTRGR